MKYTCMYTIIYSMTSVSLQSAFPIDLIIINYFLLLSSATWKEQFYPRDLIALSAEPRLIYPSHYYGDKGYISDTEHVVVEHGLV